MNKRALKLIMVLALTLTLPGSASDPPDNTEPLLTLADYLRYAALHNARLQAAFENWKAALEQIPQAQALEDPKFTYSYFIEEIETRVGPQKNRFGIMQTFPWFGVIAARTDAAAARANAARGQYEAAKLKLFREVKEAFYEFSYLTVAIDIAGENLQLLKHFEEVARIKYRTAATTHPDIIRVQMELATLEDILKSLEKLKEPTVARLNAILNRDADADLDWPRKEDPCDVQLVREDILAKVVHLNPELAALDWQTEAARADVELAKKKFYPNIGVGLDWMQTGPARMSGVSDSGEDAVALMFSLNIPLWRDSYQAAQRQAQANANKYQHQKTELQNTILAQTLQVIYDIEDNTRKIDLYGHVLVSKAEELVQSSETAYRAGTVDFLALIDAQRLWLRYKLDLERAVTNKQQNLAKLEALIGEPLPDGFAGDK